MIEIKNDMGQVLKHVDSDTLSGAELRCADLRCADLRGADLRNADLRNANLRNADLRCANLRGADLRNANLRGANLHSADFHCAYLQCVDLRKADLTDATYGKNVAMTMAPLFVTGLLWDVIFFDNHMKIGCQLHLFTTWMSLSDKEISKMNWKALSFWKQQKTALFALAQSNNRWNP